MVKNAISGGEGTADPALVILQGAAVDRVCNQGEVTVAKTSP